MSRTATPSILSSSGMVVPQVVEIVARPERRARTVRDAELPEDAPEVRLHGPLGDAQSGRDLLVREPARDNLDHVEDDRD
jgi:hypothetical protein